jgi:hypothetical protein
MIRPILILILLVGSIPTAAALGADHRDRALNYFVYPHVEVDGRTWQGRLEKQFSYREK